MTIIKGNTAKGRQLMSRAMSTEGFTLSDVYGKYSIAKDHAWQYCVNKCYEEDGRGFCICSHNSFGFSCSWVTRDGVRLETPQNSYLILCDTSADFN